MDKNKYDLYVFDVDGTLYFQNKLRMIMAFRLCTYYLCHINRIKDLLIIKDFRSLRDNAKDTDNLYELTANKNGVTTKRVKEVIKKWIYENPLDAVNKTKDTTLLDAIEGLKSNGKKIVIWSDYEAVDKLKSIGLECDGIYTAEDERVGELKPSPKGLKLILDDFKLTPDKVLMVGDRMEKDGEAAKALGVDYIILNKSEKKRRTQI